MDLSTPPDHAFHLDQMERAMACSRLFLLDRERGEELPMSADRPASALPLDELFDQLFNRYLKEFKEDHRVRRALLKPPAAVAAELEQALVDGFYRRDFLPIIEEFSTEIAEDPEGLLLLWECCLTLITALGDLIRSNSSVLGAEKALEMTVLAGPVKLSGTWKLEVDALVRIDGLVRSLWYDAQHQRVLLVDWQIHPPLTRQALALKMGLFVELVEQTRGILGEPVLFLLRPGEKQYRAKWDRLRDVLKQKLPQHLRNILSLTRKAPGDLPGTQTPAVCGLCPQKSHCDRMFGEWARPDATGTWTLVSAVSRARAP